MSSWTAASTSYSVHGMAMLPFYIYYSMFGFQRVGDQIWAAADQRARGFLIGATSGRTTLGGEGLQHQDGTSHVMAATIPNCKAYDPAFAGELAVIVDRGMREMMQEQQDVFYYITAMNENYAQPNLPQEAVEGVIKGGYRFATYRGEPAAAAAVVQGPAEVTLMGSGAILTEVIKAAQQLAMEGISSTVFSVTSWSELAREGQACIGGLDASVQATPYIALLLQESAGPIIAATDYVRAVPESVRAYLPPGRRYTSLGTDGFGRSDTRAALRSFFGVNAQSIVAAAHKCLRAARA
jgi:pyruvate dehydrogenase E1 component